LEGWDLTDLKGRELDFDMACPINFGYSLARKQSDSKIEEVEQNNQKNEVYLAQVIKVCKYLNFYQILSNFRLQGKCGLRLSDSPYAELLCYICRN
jgi:hypothetical protein